VNRRQRHVLDPEDRRADEDAQLVVRAAHQLARLEWLVPVQDGQCQRPPEMHDPGPARVVCKEEHTLRALPEPLPLPRTAPDPVTVFLADSRVDAHLQREWADAVARRDGAHLKNDTTSQVLFPDALALPREIAITVAVCVQDVPVEDQPNAVRGLRPEDD